jgi:putative transcriptional regulator
MPRIALDPQNLPQLTPEQSARLDAMTDAQITAAAMSDPDNPPLTEAELAQVSMQRLVFKARQRTGLNQAQFAKRYRITLGRLRDMEQGRQKAGDTALAAYLQVIAHDPDAVDAALGKALAG